MVKNGQTIFWRSSEDLLIKSPGNLLINLQKIFLRSDCHKRRSQKEFDRRSSKDLKKNSWWDLLTIASTMSFISSAWIVRRFLKDLSEISWDFGPGEKRRECELAIVFVPHCFCVYYLHDLKNFFATVWSHLF